MFVTTDDDVNCQIKQHDIYIHRFGLLVPDRVKLGPIWLETGPKSGRKKSKNCFSPKRPEMTNKYLKNDRTAPVSRLR